MSKSKENLNTEKIVLERRKKPVIEIERARYEHYKYT